MGTSGSFAAAVVATINGERNAQGVTLEQLSAGTGINYSTLRRLLAGTYKRDIGTGEFAAIARVLGLSPGELSGLAEARLARSSAADIISAAKDLTERQKQKLRDELARDTGPKEHYRSTHTGDDQQGHAL
jgi:transcriptional regulator with XRE-family HTH domain